MEGENFKNEEDVNSQEEKNDKGENIMNKKFERTIENFECENCGTFVQGNGYTDHCPTCLYSKHVDINPGDRLSTCGGLMKPISADVKNDGYKIYYKCEKCGYEHRVKSNPDDNFNVILGLTKNPHT